MQEKNLITELSHRMGWTLQETSDLVSALGSVVSSRLVDGDVISLQGLGQFETLKLNERVGTDEESGKQYLLPPELIPVFHADDKWKDLFQPSTDNKNEQQS